jgi:hypothetical protein
MMVRGFRLGGENRALDLQRLGADYQVFFAPKMSADERSLRLQLRRRRGGGRSAISITAGRKSRRCDKD